MSKHHAHAHSNSAHIHSTKPQRNLQAVDVDKKRQLGIDIAKKKAQIIAFSQEHDFSSGELISILSETDHLGEEKALISILHKKVEHLEGASALINEFFNLVEEFQK